MMNICAKSIEEEKKAYTILENKYNDAEKRYNEMIENIKKYNCITFNYKRKQQLIISEYTIKQLNDIQNNLTFNNLFNILKSCKGLKDFLEKIEELDARDEEWKHYITNLINETKYIIDQNVIVEHHNAHQHTIEQNKRSNITNTENEMIKLQEYMRKLKLFMQKSENNLKNLQNSC